MYSDKLFHTDIAVMVDWALKINCITDSLPLILYSLMTIPPFLSEQVFLCVFPLPACVRLCMLLLSFFLSPKSAIRFTFSPVGPFYWVLAVSD